MTVTLASSSTLTTPARKFQSIFWFAGMVVSGALAALGMAPYNLIFALAVGLTFFYLALTQAQSKKAVFLYGWAWGFGYFVYGLHWIGNALLVDGNPYAWAWPLAVSGLPFVLAFFFAMAAWCAKFFSRIETASGYIAFTAFIGFTEFLRGHILTGFPWNLFGYTWANILEIPQIIFQTDIYFLSWLTVLWLALPGFIWLHRKNLKSGAALVIVVLTSFVFVYAYGYQRLANNPTQMRDDVQIKLIQGNIDQAEKWDGHLMAQHVLKHLKLSQHDPREQSRKTTFIVWPETAISYHFFEERLYVDMIADTLSSYPGNAYLITGLLDRNSSDDTHTNALTLIDKNGATIGRYAKTHLVPFGEYIPFQQYIPLEPVTQFSGFQKGDGPKLIYADDELSFAPSICYEGIFPGILGPIEEQPDFMVNVTNDAWYGDSAGPYQHFTQARFRAIEEAVPMVRSANSGISGMIDPLGRVVQQTGLSVEDSVTTALPKSLENSRRLESFSAFFIILMLSFAGWAFRLKNNHVS